MISLEQIRQLETRVHSAVARIRSLTAENTTLKESLSDYEKRIDELERLVSGFKSDQQEIEAGIIAALAQLDGLEDAVAEPDASAGPVEEPEVSVDGPAPDMSDESDAAAESGISTAEHADSGDPSDMEPTEPESPSMSIELVESDEEEPELDIF
jgi:chromosome segregation ATPase